MNTQDNASNSGSGLCDYFECRARTADNHTSSPRHTLGNTTRPETITTKAYKNFKINEQGISDLVVFLLILVFVVGVCVLVFPQLQNAITTTCTSVMKTITDGFSGIG